LNKRKTVGQISAELLAKDLKCTHTAIDQTDENLTDYEKNIHITLDNNKKKFPNSDFYIVVLIKRERLMSNVIRNYFFARLSCPTPNYDQIVYKYHHDDDNLEFLWVVPDRETCKEMIINKANVPIEQWELLSYILKYADGSLYALAKDLNGERMDSPILKE